MNPFGGQFSSSTLGCALFLALLGWGGIVKAGPMLDAQANESFGEYTKRQEKAYENYLSTLKEVGAKVDELRRTYGTGAFRQAEATSDEVATLVLATSKFYELIDLLFLQAQGLNLRELKIEITKDKAALNTFEEGISAATKLILQAYKQDQPELTKETVRSVDAKVLTEQQQARDRFNAKRGELELTFEKERVLRDHKRRIRGKVAFLGSLGFGEKSPLKPFMTQLVKELTKQEGALGTTLKEIRHKQAGLRKEIEATQEQGRQGATRTKEPTESTKASELAIKKWEDKVVALKKNRRLVRAEIRFGAVRLGELEKLAVLKKTGILVELKGALAALLPLLNKELDEIATMLADLAKEEKTSAKSKMISGSKSQNLEAIIKEAVALLARLKISNLETDITNQVKQAKAAEPTSTKPKILNTDTRRLIDIVDRIVAALAPPRAAPRVAENPGPIAKEQLGEGYIRAWEALLVAPFTSEVRLMGETIGEALGLIASPNSITPLADACDVVSASNVADKSFAEDRLRGIVLALRAIDRAHKGSTALKALRACIRKYASTR